MSTLCVEAAAFHSTLVAMAHLASDPRADASARAEAGKAVAMLLSLVAPKKLADAAASGTIAATADVPSRKGGSTECDENESVQVTSGSPKLNNEDEDGDSELAEAAKSLLARALKPKRKRSGCANSSSKKQPPRQRSD